MITVITFTISFLLFIISSSIEKKYPDSSESIGIIALIFFVICFCVSSAGAEIGNII